MRKISILTIVLPVALLGAPPSILQGPWIGNVTRSTALFGWTTSTAGTSKIKWGTTSSSLPNSTQNALPVSIHSWFLSGLPGGSTLYYQVCSSNADGESCSPAQTFSTLAQASIPAAPQPPHPVDVPVTPTGQILTVGANCDDPTTGLVARWTQANWGDIIEIDPAVTPKCDGRYIFPAKADDNGTPHRYIMTRVKGADENLGTRQVTPSDFPKLARFVNSGPNIEMIGSTDPTTESFCLAGHLRWRQRQDNVWSMYKCVNKAPQSITEIPSSGSLDVTVPAHGYPNNSMVHVTGVTGAGAAAVNGDWYVLVLDADHLRLRFHIGAAVQSATGPASGGTIQLNAFQREPVIEDTTLPSSCTFGSWWHKQEGTGTEDEYHRTWYCSTENEWTQFRMDANFNIGFPVIDLTTNKAHNLQFQGLSFEPLPMKADPLRQQYEYQAAHAASGYLFTQFVTQSRYNHHIYWDQLLAVCADPSPTGIMVRCQGFSNPMDGAHIKVSRSYFAGFQTFASRQSIADDSSVVLSVIHGPGPHEFSNNHIECAGICIYYPDDVASTSFAGDLTFTQNYVESPDKYWDRSPSWLGLNFGGDMFWSQRHRFEAKRLIRGAINGNHFVGGWVWNNNAAAICLCERGGGTGAQLSSLNNNTLTTYDAGIGGDWGIEDFKVGDLVQIRNLAGGNCPENPTQVYTVTSMLSPISLILSPSLECTATRGNVSRIMNQTATITDISIANNNFTDSPTGIFLLGHDTNAGINSLPSAAMQRISISNNLAVRLDGSRVGLGAFSGNPSVAPAGTFIVALCGMEDLSIVHNTVFPRTIAGFLNFDLSTCEGAPSSGLALKANIFEYLSGYGVGSPIGGSTALASAWRSGNAPEYTALYNVILRPGGASGPPNDPSIPPFGPYPGRTLWFDSNQTLPFKDPANGDYSLVGVYRHGDKCFGTVGDCTDDGLDIGVDLLTLMSFQNRGADKGSAVDLRGNFKSSGRVYVP